MNKFNRQPDMIFDPPTICDQFPAIGGGASFDPDRFADHSTSHHPTGPRITRDDADVIVESAAELPEPPTGAEVIWFPGGTEIDLTGVTRHYQGTKILASGRGTDVGAATLIYDDHPQPAFRLDGDGSRITGLHVEGPDGDNFNTNGGDYERGLDACFASINGARCEVDNNLIRGWTYAGIEWGRESYPNWAHTHHNTIVDCNCMELGYGIVIASGMVRVQRNYLDNNRHHVATWNGAGYRAMDNIGGPHARLHAFDLHGPTPRRVIFERNIVLSTHNTYDESGPSDIGQEALYIRGKPAEGGRIEGNVFAHGRPPAQPFDDSANGPILINNVETFADAGVTLAGNAWSVETMGDAGPIPRAGPEDPDESEPTPQPPTDAGLTIADVKRAVREVLREGVDE